MKRVRCNRCEVIFEPADYVRHGCEAHPLETGVTPDMTVMEADACTTWAVVGMMAACEFAIIGIYPELITWIE